MTKKQKEQRIQGIKDILINRGFSIDSWGNYKFQGQKEVFRVKLMKTNLRFEVKDNRAGSRWFKIVSQPIVNINIDSLVEYLERRVK